MATTQSNANRVGLLGRQLYIREDYPAEFLTPSYLKRTRVPDLYASCVILTVLAITATVLRCMARRKTRIKLALDDYSIILASMFFTALSIFIIVTIYEVKLGLHWSDISHAQDDRFFKLLLFIQLLYICTMGAVKTSLLLLYLRLFGVSRHFRFAVYGAALVIACWFFGLTITAILSSFYLAILQPRDSVLASGLGNLLTDLMILCFPLRMVLRLKMNTRKKAKLAALFLLGLFACIASLMRIVYLVNWQGYDQTYESARIVVWTVVECGLSIITASTPIIGLLFKDTDPLSSEGPRSSYLSRIFSRNKSAGHAGSETRTRSKNRRRGWSAQKSQDESQIDIVQSDDGIAITKSSRSNDEEMNWTAIEMTAPEDVLQAKVARKNSASRSLAEK